MSGYDDIRGLMKGLSLADLVAVPRYARQELERRMTALENTRRESENELRRLKSGLADALAVEHKRDDALIEDTEGLKFAEPMG